MASRRICFDGQQVFVRWQSNETQGEDVPGLLDFLFADLPRQGDGEGDTRFDISRNAKSGYWTLNRNGNRLFTGRELNGLGNILSGEVLFSLIENNTRNMAIHAGLVSNTRGSMLLPADSGSGKSSVTTWLLSKGWGYHTDELVMIDIENSSLTAFTRPLNIKVHGLEPVSEIFDIDRHRAQMRSCNMVTMIPHRLVNPRYNPRIPPLTTIVFPVFSRDMEPGLQPLGGAEAGLEMMRSNVIARNLPGHGFTSVAKLVRNLPAYRLHYQHFDNLETLLAPLGH